MSIHINFQVFQNLKRFIQLNILNTNEMKLKNNFIITLKSHQNNDNI